MSLDRDEDGNVIIPVISVNTRSASISVIKAGAAGSPPESDSLDLVKGILLVSDRWTNDSPTGGLMQSDRWTNGVLLLSISPTGGLMDGSFRI
jgi:hypothetical protein